MREERVLGARVARERDAKAATSEGFVMASVAVGIKITTGLVRVAQGVAVVRRRIPRVTREVVGPMTRRCVDVAPLLAAPLLRVAVGANRIYKPDRGGRQATVRWQAIRILECEQNVKSAPIKKPSIYRRNCSII